MRKNLFKSVITISLVTALSLVLIACNSEETVPAEPEIEPVTEISEEPAEEPAEEPVEEPAEEPVEEPVEVSVNASDIYDAVTSEVSLITPVKMTDDFLENYYGIDLSVIDSYVCSMSEDATSAETVFIVTMKDESAAQSVIDCVTMVRDDKAAEMQDYLPEQYEIVDKSSVQNDGKYIWLVISENADTINGIIENSIKGN